MCVCVRACVHACICVIVYVYNINVMRFGKTNWMVRDGVMSKWETVPMRFSPKLLFGWNVIFYVLTVTVVIFNRVLVIS